MANNLLAGSKADGGDTGTQVSEVVVVVGYGDDLVLLPVVVGMTNEGCLIVLLDY